MTRNRRCGSCLQMRPLRNGAHYCDECRELARIRNAEANMRQKAGTCSECKGPTSRRSRLCCNNCRILKLQRQARERNARRQEEQLCEAPTGKKPCKVCCDMTWRVRGIRCVCGLRYAAEHMPEIDEFLDQRKAVAR